jgi:hypothetical protein
MSDYLILWNNTKFATLLADKLAGSKIITCSTDFGKLGDTIFQYNALIVLCELDWSIGNEKIQCCQFSGIELVKQIRREYDYISPVLFVSFFSLHSIFNTEREIITAIGHDFLQLPVTPDDFITTINNRFTNDNGIISKLSEMELTDIKSFYCSKEGILSHELHQLNAYLNYNITTENQTYIYTQLENSIRRIHELFLESSTTNLLSFQITYPNLTKNNINEAVNSIVLLGNNLLKKYSNVHGNLPKENNIDQLRWKVLMLDDEINDEHELVILMRTNKINVICVNSVSDALSALIDDWRTENLIMVVIADYRLYEYNQGIKRHQKIQGYQFLKNIASTDHLVRLVAFSGLQRKFLLNSFKHFNIRTEVKSKTDYLSSEQTRQFFCDEIIEMAEENLEVIEEMPSKCAGFKKNLEDAYKAFRMHPDYYKMESIVTLTAKEYAWEINQQINAGQEIIIGSIENIKSPLAKTKKDEEAYFKRLNNFLIARRIALWLYAASRKGNITNIDSRRIAEILTNQKYSTDAYRQIISTNLGLSLDDFPKNITIEERRWLQYEMQLNIFRDISMINPVLTQIANYFKDFIIQNEELKDKIKNNKQSLNHKYKQTIYNINFTKDFTPEIKTTTDVRVLFLLIIELIKSNKIQPEQLKPLVSRIRLALFESRVNVIYLKNLFQYFNTLYRLLNKEQTVLLNPSSKIKDKSNFLDSSKPSINIVYGRTYELLVNSLLPNENDSADVFSVFITGEDVVEKSGRGILEDKAKFFTLLTKQINNQSNLIGDSYNENFKNNNYFDSEYDDEVKVDEYETLYNNEELN